jgi:acetolactate synthase-1/2/3 large subunit
MNTADAIIKFLEKESVSTIFGYPGGAVLPIYKSLKNSTINHILVRHEQTAIHAASGYALSTNTVGVCIATSGPGATNLMTGIANAYMDSIPVVIITGQVSTDSIGFDSFQEADIIGATEAFTKYNYLIKDEKDIARVFKEAFYIANTGRKGPVLIDIPVNIQNKIINYNYPKNIDILGYKPTFKGNINQINKAYEKICFSKKPLLCIGNGILLSNAKKELLKFVNNTQIPVVNTLKGKGAFNETNPNYIGMIGSHGHKYANNLIEESDLLIIIGMSISNRTTANFSANTKNIIHIDVDPAEVGKNIISNLPIIGDAKKILEELNNFKYNSIYSEWMDFIKYEKTNHNTYLGKNKIIDRKLSEISDNSSEDAIFIADVGNNQIAAAHNIKMFGQRKFFTSGRLGTMGFSLPASIGAKISDINREVVVIIGDGSFQMVMNELITLYENNLNVKIILIDNQSLGMVRDLQKYHYKETFAVNFKSNPDFSKICDANNVTYFDLNSELDINKFIKYNSLCLGRIKQEDDFYE